MTKRSQGDGILAEPRRTVPGKGKVPFDPGWFWRQFREVAAPDYAEDLGPCRIWRDYPVDLCPLPDGLC